MADANGRAPSPPSSDPQPTMHTPPPTQPQTTAIDTSLSSTDDAASKRPRDARLIHMLLASAGITAYQDRVPLQLMDFAYRYTSSTLQDALHLTNESYGSALPPGAKGAQGADGNSVSLLGLRLSVASRTHYQFSPVLSKEFYMEVAAERNRVALPGVGREWGRRLPPERYCLTGVGWGLKEEWDSEGEEEGLPESVEKVGDGGDFLMGDENEGDELGDEEGDQRMEDFFGEDVDQGEDKGMEE